MFRSLAYSGLKTDMRSSELTVRNWKHYLLRGTLAVAMVTAIAGGFYWFIATQQPDFARAWGGFKSSESGGTISPAGVDLIDLDLDVVRQPKRIRGKVRNATDRAYERVEVTFALTNSHGSQLDAKTVTVQGIAAKSATPFEVPVTNDDVAYYMVRDVVAF
jgi:hypothetical protein